MPPIRRAPNTATSQEREPERRGRDRTPSITRQQARDLPDAAPYIIERYGRPPSIPLTLSNIPDPINNAPVNLKFLVTVAIYSSPERMLSLDGIRAALMDRFTYFRNTGKNTTGKSENKGWKGSVRHCLSFYKPFRRIRKDAATKGNAGLWTIDITFPDPFGTKRRPKRKSNKGGNSSPESNTSEIELESSPNHEYYERPLFTYEPRFQGVRISDYGDQYPSPLVSEPTLPELSVPQTNAFGQFLSPFPRYPGSYTDYTDEDAVIHSIFNWDAFLGSHSSASASSRFPPCYNQQHPYVLH